MSRKFLLTLATATLVFGAAPAFAQSSYGGDTGDSYGNSSAADIERDKRKAERKARKAEKKRIKAAQMAEEEKAKMATEELAKKEKTMKDHSSATGATMAKDHSSATGSEMVKDHSSATDAMTKKDDAMMKKDDVMMDKGDVMMKKSIKPVNCPAGTTPQDNGTCMLN